MRIITTEEMRAWDEYTMQSDTITSLDLMERAAMSVKRWIDSNIKQEVSFMIFSGPGNNGGDGLAVARLLLKDGIKVSTYLIKSKGELSIDCGINEKLLWEAGGGIHYIKTKEDLKEIQVTEPTIIIDAILGSGLKEEPYGIIRETIEHVNEMMLPVISLDIPSGMYGDKVTSHENIIYSEFVLSFQLPKLALLIEENEEYINHWAVLDIGLNFKYLETFAPDYNYLILADLMEVYQEPGKFDHKNLYGHGMLLAGSRGMAGASILAAKAALRTGIGKLTVAVTERNYIALQTAVPEAMVTVQGEMTLSRLPENIQNYTVAVGPGLGINSETEHLVEELLKKVKKPMVIDADALNILSKKKLLWKKIPKDSILTPHKGEWERWVGKAEDSIQEWKRLRTMAKELDCNIVLKGAHTAIALKSGELYINSTGNVGLATAGSGDVLTGMIMALLARGYEPSVAALMGVALHGRAGDEALNEQVMESMIASDIVENIPKAYRAMINIGQGMEKE